MGYMLARNSERGSWDSCDSREAEETHLALVKEETRLALASIQQLDPAPYPLAYLQSATLLSIYYFNKSDLAQSRSILESASTMVMAHYLDETMLDSGGPAQTCTEVKRMGFKWGPVPKTGEVQAVLAQFVYLDLLHTILLKLPSVIDPRLHARFKALIVRPLPCCAAH
jgi:hypothetical protein